MTPQQAATAPLSELRDWCAGDDGWFPIDPADRISHDEWWRWTINGTAGGKTWCMHPYPATRDGAAAALPEGWAWWRLLGFREWYAAKLDANGRITGWGVTIPDTGDESADRFRLAVLCRLAAKEATNGKA